MEASRTYAEGDWIAHAHYGIGQIRGIEVKGISGEETRYYRVQSVDSTFWIPVDQMDSDFLRPLSSPEELQKAIAVLQRPPKEMSSNHNTRRSRIRQVQLQNTPKAMAQLIRDLRARQRAKGALNIKESNAFKVLKKRLVQEWAIVTDARTEKVVTHLEDLLDGHNLKANR